jgi:hypothetical protein
MKKQKSISNQINLSNESAERILSENGFELANFSVNNICYRFEGYGHWTLECEIADQDNWKENVILKRTTTNSNLIDDWGEEESYFQDENSGHWYNSNEEVFEAAFDFILSSEENREKLSEFLA